MDRFSFQICSAGSFDYTLVIEGIARDIAVPNPDKDGIWFYIDFPIAGHHASGTAICQQCPDFSLVGS
jgi:hypothetical protein